MSIYGDKTYRKKQSALKHKAKRLNLPCHLCGKPFDWTITNYHDPGAFSADHVEAIANGGKLLGELAPCHRGCNSSRGRKRLASQVEQVDIASEW